MTEDRKIRLLLWSGPICIGLVLVGWMVFAGFLPPPRPTLSDAEVSALWQHKRLVKQLGMVLCVWGGVLYAPFTTAIAMYLRRCESGRPVWSIGQAALGVFGTVFFSLNFLILAMVPFRPAQISHTLHDVGMAMTFAPVAPFACQYLLIAIVILQDNSARPAVPRWVGFANVWVAIGFLPASLIPLFDRGPIAWNGLLSFWIPVGVFVAWFGIMFWAGRRALTRQQAEPPSPGSPAQPPATVPLLNQTFDLQRGQRP